MTGEEPESRLGAPADIRRGVTRLAQRLRAERPAGALSANKISVLSHLYQRGPSTPGEIAAAEHQHPQSLTRVFTELQLDGLVFRSRSDRDGRESLLTLTAAGREALARDMAHRDMWLSDALSGLTAAEVGLLKIAAGLMEQVAEAAAADSRSAGSSAADSHAGASRDGQSA
jgi:DNA-binding MarR family transcriptional regulator